jgi:hypothetical protein
MRGEVRVRIECYDDSGVLVEVYERRVNYRASWYVLRDYISKTLESLSGEYGWLGK